MSVKHNAAVLNILNRVVVDRTFSGLMMGTETLNLCLHAEAYRTGKTVEECEQWLQKRMELEDQRLKAKFATVETTVDGLFKLANSLPMSSGFLGLPPIEFLEATALP